MRFEWNQRKARANLRKHGVSFEEAETAFSDLYVKYILDAEHSEFEDRYWAIGMSKATRLLLVCHCYRYGDVIRIFSARKATPLEATLYQGDINVQ